MDPARSAAWIEGNGAPATKDAVRAYQVALLCTTAIDAMLDLHVQYTDKLLTKEQFGRECVRFRGLLSQPALRAYWTENRDDIGKAAPNFRAFVDDLMVGDAAEFRIKV